MPEGGVGSALRKALEGVLAETGGCTVFTGFLRIRVCNRRSVQSSALTMLRKARPSPRQSPGRGTRPHHRRDRGGPSCRGSAWRRGSGSGCFGRPLGRVQRVQLPTDESLLAEKRPAQGPTHERHNGLVARPNEEKLRAKEAAGQVAEWCVDLNAGREHHRCKQRFTEDF